jgi:hypothetical protein
MLTDSDIRGQELYDTSDLVSWQVAAVHRLEQYLDIGICSCRLAHGVEAPPMDLGAAQTDTAPFGTGALGRLTGPKHAMTT